MPQEPKKRHSRARQGKRRAAIKLGIRSTILCSNCQKPILPHIICKNCGFYKGQEVVNVNKKKLAKEKKAKEAEANTA